MVPNRQKVEAPIHIATAGTRDNSNRGFSRLTLTGVSMVELLVLILGFLALLSILKGRPIEATVDEESPCYNRPSYAVPGYHDDEQIRQYRRREREKDRRAEESCWNW